MGSKERPETSNLFHNITPRQNTKDLEQPFVYSFLTLFLFALLFFRTEDHFAVFTAVSFTPAFCPSTLV